MFFFPASQDTVSMSVHTIIICLLDEQLQLMWNNRPWKQKKLLLPIPEIGNDSDDGK